MTKNIDMVLMVAIMGGASELTIDRGEMIDYQNSRVSARHYNDLLDKVIKLLNDKRERLINLQGFYDALPDSVNSSSKEALAVAIEEVKATIADMEKIFDE